MKYLLAVLKMVSTILAVFAFLCSIPILIEWMVFVCLTLVTALSISLATTGGESWPKGFKITVLVVLAIIYFYQADNLFGWINLISEGFGHIVIPFGWPNITFPAYNLFKVMWWVGWGCLFIGSLPLLLEFFEDPKRLPETQPESGK